MRGREVIAGEGGPGRSGWRRRAGLMLALMLVLPAADCFPKREKTFTNPDGSAPDNFGRTRPHGGEGGGGGYGY
jgi:hypothetical protein